MIINLEYVFKEPDGKEIVKEVGSAEKLTLRHAMEVAVLQQYEGERLSPKDKYRRYQLFKKIHDWPNADLDLTSDERNVAKTCISKLFEGALIPGQTWEILTETQEK